MKKVLFAVAVALAAWGMVGTASAWDGPFLGWGAGWWYPRGSLYARESIPYFAENPPVYYSHPVARPYGYSPYAYPPTVLTPETKLACQPLVVVNPYVAQDGAMLPSVAPQPKRIVNPYVTPQ